MATEIVSWNVNGLRAVMRTGFTEWIERVKPDVLCLQEVRSMPDQLTAKQIAPKGYTSFWSPGVKPGYSGVATYTRLEPISVTGLGKREFDDEGRVQVIEFSEYTIINAYFPNSQPERRRIEYKLAFCRAIRRYCNQLVKAGKHIVLCGDYNIAHEEIDLARPKANVNSPGFLPEEREEMSRFLKAGYVDTFRHFCKEPGHYTWWSYRAGARARNVGWRIDYHCINRELLPRLKGASILCEVTGSDHCPVAIKID